MPRLRLDIRCPNPTGNPKCTGRAPHGLLCRSCAALKRWSKRKPAGPAPAAPAAAAPPADAGDAGPNPFGDLEREISGLIGDCDALGQAVQARFEAVRRKNVVLLKSVMRRRRQIQRLRASLLNARAAAAEAEETDPDDDEDEPEEP